MSDYLNRENRDFSKYDTMETNVLQDILRLDAEAPEDAEQDTELLLYIMEVLAKRRRSEPNPGITAQEALKVFEAHYLPCVEETYQAEKPIQSNMLLRWRRGLSAAAAVLIVIVLGSVTAGAFGFNVLGAVAKWTQETFFFESIHSTSASEPSKDYAPMYTSLQELLKEYNVKRKLVPTWLPEGYEFVEAQVSESPKQRYYFATYEKEGKSIKVQIKDYLDFHPTYAEKSDGLVEVYESYGIAYYIFSNYNQIHAAWSVENYECTISGPVSITEMKKIIDSIEKG